MSIQKRNGDCPPPDNGCNVCKDKDNATQKSINVQRAALCTTLYESEGAVEQQQAKFDGLEDILKDKRCMFIHTEDNYLRYRNLEICVGTELLQTNDSIKTNVAGLNKLNADLNKVLTDLIKQTKDIKNKFADLKAAACKLDGSIDDGCNAAQWKAITGKTKPGCNEEGKPPIDACKNAEAEIYSLICLPKGLGKDIDTIFQSSADVTGIQMFSNIDTLDPLVKTLADNSNKFEKLVSDTMKTRKGELDKLQSDLVDSVKNLTKAAMDRNSSRSTFEGYYDATDFLCCPTNDCNCITVNLDKEGTETNNCRDNCDPRLQNCGMEICQICKVVQDTFCCGTEDNPDKKCD